MRIANIIESTGKFLSGIKIKRDPKLAKMDFGILRVAMMVAALDGRMQVSEMEVFRKLAKKCRGYSEKSEREALLAGQRSAGYLMLLAQTGSEKELLNAFVDEALLVMPSGFLNGSVEDVRRAFIMWTAMALGDGEFDTVERKAIKFLKQTWCEMKRALVDAQTECWLATQVDIRMVCGQGRSVSSKIKLLEDDFLDRVEAALRTFDEVALLKIIKNG